MMGTMSPLGGSPRPPRAWRRSERVIIPGEIPLPSHPPIITPKPREHCPSEVGRS
jgi:hypothetical protein